jgi:hypothetical protein
VVLFRKTEGWSARTDPVSQETSTELQSSYETRLFFGAGLVYVGPDRNGIDDVTCGAPSKTCLPYTMGSGSITIGGTTVPYARSGREVTLGDQKWQYLPAEKPAPGRFALAGYFGYQSGSGAVVDGVSLELAADGSFTASRTAPAGATRLPKQIFGVEFWSQCVRPPAGGCVLEGTYTLRSHSLEISARGKSKKLFFRQEGAELQIGDDWYRPL